MIHINKKTKKQSGQNVNAILRTQLAHLWPTISDNAKLQQECEREIPQLFVFCQAIRVEAGQLIVAAPNAAIATKLKHQTPKLIASLQKTGWQINAIRIKVQVTKHLDNNLPEKQINLSASAKDAFAKLESDLARSNKDNMLLEPIRALLDRNR